MNNDRISRSALIKDFQDRLRKAQNWKENAINRSDDEIVIRADATINFICEVIMTINNAPTVTDEPKGNYQKRALELVDNLKDKGAINNRECGTLRRAILLEPARPQGKWLEYYGNGELEYMCSECSAKETNPQIARYCYCCGADMRGEDK